ncbi:peptidylprolyl isomerase [Draconibacterium sp.]|nr:peptidylprolyl isomerase [Draconibacterium sp.]
MLSKKYYSGNKMKKSIFLNAIAVFLFTQVFGQALPKVIMETTLGVIIVEVDTAKAPTTAKNFLKHVETNTYKNGVFYRVVRMDNQPKNDVKIEVIQGGIYTEPRFGEIQPIEHETTAKTGLRHLNGTISMARMGPGTASTEFFICIGDQPELDFGGKRNADGQGFAAFGQVVEGMDVVREIQKQKDKNQTLLEKIGFAVSVVE